MPYRLAIPLCCIHLLNATIIISKKIGFVNSFFEKRPKNIIIYFFLELFYGITAKNVRSWQNYPKSLPQRTEPENAILCGIKIIID